MVINDFYVSAYTVFKDKVNAVLLIDAYAVLSCPVSMKQFQMVSGRNP